MRSGRFFFAFITAFAILQAAPAARALQYDITGGRPYEARVGHGMSLTLGGVDCTGDLCGDKMDTSLLGSFSGGVGYFNRLIPNLVIFADIATGYVRPDSPATGISGAKGFMFEIVGGGEFHAPLTGWLDLYLGLGIGWTYLGFWAEQEDTGQVTAQDGKKDVHYGLDGITFQIRTGADFFLFSQLPFFSIGPYFKLEKPAWFLQCIEGVSGNDDCKAPRDWSGMGKIKDRPLLVHLGIAAKWGF